MPRILSCFTRPLTKPDRFRASRATAWADSATPETRIVVGALFALVLSWSLLEFGAAENRNKYRLLFLLSAPLLVATWRLSRPLFREARFLPVMLVGLFLSTQIILRTTLEGVGYVALTSGWMAFLLILLLTTGPLRSAGWIVLTLILLGGLEAIYGLIQSIGGVDYIGSYYREIGRRSSGTLINPNHFAGFLNMIIALSFGTLWAGFQRQPRLHRSERYARAWIMVVCAAFMALAVLMSLSRGGVLTLILTMAFIFALWRASRMPAPGGLRIGPWLLLTLAITMGAWVGLGGLFSRFADSDLDGRTRILIYQDTLEMISESPLVGVGPGMYRWRFRPYQTADTDHLYTSAHNDYLQTAAEWGVPLAALFWSFVTWRLYRSAKLFLGTQSRLRGGLAMGCAAAIFSVLVHSLTDSTLQIPSNLMVFGTVLALSWTLDAETGTRFEPDERLKVAVERRGSQA